MKQDAGVLLRAFAPLGVRRACLPLVFALAFSTIGGCSGGPNADADQQAAGAAAEAQADEHADDDHAEEGEAGRVTLTEEAFRTAGIAVQPVTMSTASARPAIDLVVPGQVAHDPARLAVVSSCVPGRLERLTVVEGDRVGAGQAVALLYSSTYLTAQSDLQQARRAEGARLRALVPLETIAGEVLEALRQLEATTDERRLSLEEAAELSGYSSDHLRRLARKGKLLHTREGRRLLFRAADLPRRSPKIDAPDIGAYDPVADARKVAGIRAHGGI